MKTIFTILLIIISSELHSQILLDSAYSHQSAAQLKEIFDKWAGQSKPISKEELKLKCNYERYAYQIFEDFYTPKAISRIGHSEFGDSVYSDIEYAFIQNEVHIGIYNKLIVNTYDLLNEPKPFNELKLVDFRPRVKVPGAKVIYLDDSTKSIINNFLKYQFTPWGEENLMNPASAEGESQRRLEFINKYARVYPSHWGDFWKIETCPTISIRFNKTFTKAAVDFRLFYQGGTALYERKSNKWKLRKSSLIWIE